MVPISVLSDTESTHTVQFYEEDEALIERLAEYAGSALGGGHACVIVATVAHRHALELQLLRRGMHTDQMIDEGRFLLLDAADTLKLFMVDGRLHPGLFFTAIEEILSRASSSVWASRGRVAVFGEMVALLWTEGNADAAVQLEGLWNELGKKHSFSLLCAYPMRSFNREEDQAAFKRICGEHTHVVPCESFGKLSDDARRLQNICDLQQKAQMLQGEIVRRKKAEAALTKCEESKRLVN
jgi:hypothetical protein